MLELRPVREALEQALVLRELPALRLRLLDGERLHLLGPVSSEKNSFSSPRSRYSIGVVAGSPSHSASIARPSSVIA